MTKQMQFSYFPFKLLSLTLLTAFLLALPFAQTSQASGFYLRPHLGATIDLDDSDTGYSLGVALGYQVNPYVALELDYARIIANFDANVIEARGKIGLPLPMIHPYGIIGAGLFIPDLAGADTQPLVRVGGGAILSILPIVNFIVEASYVHAGDSNQYFEPVIGIAIGG